MHMIELIEAKKAGLEHQPAAIGRMVQGFVSGDVPDYQMAAWLMAVRWRGLSRAETLALTQAFVDSGATLDLAGAGLQSPFIDKHSTGGVGDKLTLVLVPLLIAAGATVVKLSGRCLGHTGGTIDKLSAIPGFRSNLDVRAILATAQRVGGCIAVQTPELVPADGLVYALRDVTGTVDSLPLIAASIMAKKLAAGAQTIVLDIKVGSGAFMRDLAEATELASLMVDIAAGADRQAVAVLTGMDQPLGHAVGNAIEINETLAVLRGGGPPEVRDLALALAAETITAAGLAPDPSKARTLAAGHLDSGRALEKFLGLVAEQGSSAAAARLTQANPLPLAGLRGEIIADRSGSLTAIDALGVGLAAVALGAGRSYRGAEVDPGAGVQLVARAGDQIEAGRVLAYAYASESGRLARGSALLQRAFLFTRDDDAGLAERPEPRPSGVLRVIHGADRG